MRSQVHTFRLARVCYDTLLRAYPRPYRDQFAPDMRDTFLRDLSRVMARGWLALIPFWIVTVAQAVWFGGAERRSSGAPMPGPSSPRFRWSPSSDVRYALRMLARSPLFTVTSVLSLCLGLAAAAVIFSLADALLLQSSPGVRHSDRVVDIARATNGSGADNMSHPVFRHVRDHARSFDGMAGTTMDPAPMSLVDGQGSERVFGQTVSAGYFETAGVQPALGRFFRPDEDDVADAHPVAVLTHRYWRERFQQDPGVLERTVRLNNTPFRIIGIAAPEFEGTTFVGTDLWVPMAMVGVARGGDGAAMLQSPRNVWHTAVGRLREGVTREAAQAELNTLLVNYRQTTPDVPESHSIVVTPSGPVPAGVRVPFAAFIGLLFALAAGLLAVACSNVAGMLMARATARRREIATRLAIGASRGQVVVQLMTETVVLFLAAVVVAAPLTWWLMTLLEGLLPALPLPLRLDLSLDPRTMSFAAGLALLSGLVFGLIPARHALRTDLSSALHGHASTTSRERQRFRHGLVVAQVALSLTMVITAALFVRSLLSAATIDPGFSTERIDVVSVDTTMTRASREDAGPMVGRVAERLRAVGGVEAVAHSRMIPLQGGGMGLGGVRVPGASETALRVLNDADWDVVSPEYFSTLSLPIVAGRPFSVDDREGRPLVAVVNEWFAASAWPGQSAIGQRLWQTESRDDEGRAIEVVGVARDAKYRMLGESPRAFIYVPFAQQPQRGVTFYVRHQSGRRAVAELRRAVTSEEASLAVIQVQSFDEATAIALFPQRLAAWVAGVVGTLGLFLAALGLYGLMSFLVAQRTREIAIRVALGATAAQVRSMVIRRVALLAATGVGLGLVVAAVIGSGVQAMGLLLDVTPTDPISFVGLSLLLIALLLVAGDIPARRASRTHPALTLKTE